MPHPKKKSTAATRERFKTGAHECARRLCEQNDTATHLLRSPKYYACAVNGDGLTEKRLHVYQQLAEDLLLDAFSDLDEVESERRWTSIIHFALADEVGDDEIAAQARLLRALIAYPDELADALTRFDLQNDWEDVREPINLALGFVGRLAPETKTDLGRLGLMVTRHGIVCQDEDEEICTTANCQGQKARQTVEREQQTADKQSLAVAEQTYERSLDASAESQRLLEELRALEREIEADLPDGIVDARQNLEKKLIEIHHLQEQRDRLQKELTQLKPGWFARTFKNKLWPLHHQIETFDQALEKLSGRAADWQQEIADLTAELALARTKRETLERDILDLTAQAENLASNLCPKTCLRA